MLTDISSFAAEAVLQGFAPSLLDLAPSDLPAELLYLRFAMIAAYLQDPAFEAAIARVTSQPHRTWVSEQEIRPIGSPFPAGAAFRRAVCAPGRRVPWAGGSATLASLPAALTRDRAEASVDNSANQFVKFALERWRAVALELFEVLSQASQKVESGPLRRGQQIAAGRWCPTRRIPGAPALQRGQLTTENANVGPGVTQARGLPRSLPDVRDD